MKTRLKFTKGTFFTNQKSSHSFSETLTSCVESVKITERQIDGVSNMDTQHSSLTCNEKLHPPSPKAPKRDEENPCTHLHKLAVPKPPQKVVGGPFHPVVPLTDVCTTGDKMKWKEKVLKIQPIKLSTGLNLLMDYETSSGESTPLDSPFVGKIDSISTSHTSSSHTSFAFPPAAASEPLNDNLNLLAYLASLHGCSASKENYQTAETETKVESKNGMYPAYVTLFSGDS